MFVNDFLLLLLCAAAVTDDGLTLSKVDLSEARARDRDRRSPPRVESRESEKDTKRTQPAD